MSSVELQKNTEPNGHRFFPDCDNAASCCAASGLHSHCRIVDITCLQRHHHHQHNDGFIRHSDVSPCIMLVADITHTVSGEILCVRHKSEIGKLKKDFLITVLQSFTLIPSYAVNNSRETTTTNPA